MADFQQYIKPELLILIPVLYLIGEGIKKTKIANNFIPLILGVVSVLISGVWLFATEPINGSQAIATAIFTALTQGVLCAGAAVYANQLIKQGQKED